MLLFLQINNEFDQSGTNFPFDTKSAWWKTLRNKMEENRQEIEVGSVKDSSKVPSNCCFTRQAWSSHHRSKDEDPIGDALTLIMHMFESFVYINYVYVFATILLSSKSKQNKAKQKCSSWTSPWVTFVRW